MNQKQHQDDEQRKVDQQRREQAQQQGDDNRPDDAEIERMRHEDPLFIEKTKPEDPSGRPGQQTRDNVNPAIPSGKRGDPPNSGGIVDPNSLGMEQGGKEPNYPPPREELRKQREEEAEGTQLPDGAVSPRWASINEPPGSNVYDQMPTTPGTPLPPEGEVPPVKPPPGTEPPLGEGDDPDEIEDELEQMEAEGDVKSTKPSKRKR